MIWRRLKKSTPEQDEQFRQTMSDAKVTWKDKLAMMLSAYVTILLPCLLVLLVFGFLILLLFGAL